MRELAVNIVLGAVVFTGGWYLAHLRRIPESGRWRYMKMTLSDVEHACADYNDMKLAEYIRGNKLHNDRHKLSHLETILKLLFAEMPEAVRGGHAHIVKDHSCDSMSFPNTVIYVHQGLLDMTASNDEIAFIFARQLAHVQLNHLGEVMSRRWALSSLLSPLLCRPLAWLVPSPLLHALVSWRLTWTDDVIEKCVHELSVDYTLQSEADTLALRSMSKACFDPRGAASILTKFTVQELLHTVNEQLKHDHAKLKYNYKNTDNGEPNQKESGNTGITTELFTHETGMPSWLKYTQVPNTRITKPISAKRLEKIKSQLVQMAAIRAANDCFKQNDEFEHLSQATMLHLKLYDWLYDTPGLWDIKWSPVQRKIHENLKKENLAFLKKGQEYIQFGEEGKEEGLMLPSNVDSSGEGKEEGMTGPLVRQLSWRSDVIFKSCKGSAGSSVIPESVRTALLKVAKRREENNEIRAKRLSVLTGTSSRTSTRTPTMGKRQSKPDPFMKAADAKSGPRNLANEKVAEKTKPRNTTNEKVVRKSKYSNSTNDKVVRKSKHSNPTNEKIVVEVEWKETGTSKGNNQSKNSGLNQRKIIPKVKLIRKKVGTFIDRTQKRKK